MRKLRWLTAVACAAFWASPCAAQDAASTTPPALAGLQVLTIDDAVRTAVDHNLTLLASRAKSPRHGRSRRGCGPTR